MNEIDLSPLETTGKVMAISLNAVPLVGGVLSDIANEVIAKRQNRRLNGFLADLAEKLNSVSDKINQEFIKTDDFENLVEDIFLKAAETRQHEKLNAFRSIFINTIISDRPNYDELAEIAQLIERWQPRHLILLKILSNPLEADIQRGRVVGNGGGFSTSLNQIIKKLLPEWYDEQIARTWQELYEAKIHNTSGTRGMMTDQGIHQLENLLTPYGQKVISYLRDIQ